MSTQHRTTHNSMEDKSGGSGCAVFLIIAGLGLAVLAIGFGLVASFIMIDASDTGAIVVEDVIVDEVTEVEETVESPGTSNDPPATYPERIADITDRIRTASDDYTGLTARIGERDEVWEAELFEVFAVWRDADAEVGRIVPPPAHAVSHNLLKQATEEYREAADIVEPKINAGELNPFAEGAELIPGGALTLRLAESMLADELD